MASKPQKTRRVRSAAEEMLNFHGRELEEQNLLPQAFRARLHGLFNQIEREFEALYSENLLCNLKITIYIDYSFNFVYIYILFWWMYSAGKN